MTLTVRGEVEQLIKKCNREHFGSLRGTESNRASWFWLLKEFIKLVVINVFVYVATVAVIAATLYIIF